MTTTPPDVFVSPSGWRSLAPRPPCPACAATRASMLDAGVLRPAGLLTPLPPEEEDRAFLAIDQAGRASAQASLEGRLQDQRIIDGALRRMPPRNRRRDT